MPRGSWASDGLPLAQIRPKALGGHGEKARWWLAAAEDRGRETASDRISGERDEGSVTRLGARAGAGARERESECERHEGKATK